jgi:hypothetical protein
MTPDDIRYELMDAVGNARNQYEELQGEMESLNDFITALEGEL